MKSLKHLKLFEEFEPLTEEVRDLIIDPKFITELEDAGFESWTRGKDILYIKNEGELIELIIKALAKDKLVAYVKYGDKPILNKQQFSNATEAIKYLNSIKTNIEVH